jgi:hypothetical protein
VPLLRKLGHTVVYVDLWSNRNTDPAQLLKESLYEAIAQQAGRVAKAAKSATKALGLTKITALSTLQFELGDQEKNSYVSLTMLLTRLADKSKTKKVVLIVDEAQQALTTPTGENAMFGLKAARDALNIARKEFGLVLLCTGSSRSKLSGLVRGKESPFFGAQVVDFPVLGEDFIKAYTDFTNPRLMKAKRITAEAMAIAFDLLGHRPEDLFHAAGAAVMQSVAGANDLSNALILAAKQSQADTLSHIQSQFDPLPATQQAVLLNLLETEKTGFTPYSKETLDKYAKYTKSKVSVTAVQAALKALVLKGIVWQAKRGTYSIDDPLWFEWWVERQASK